MPSFCFYCAYVLLAKKALLKPVGERSKDSVAKRIEAVKYILILAFIGLVTVIFLSEFAFKEEPAY